MNIGVDSGPWRTKEYLIPEDGFKTLFVVESFSFIGLTDSLSLLPVDCKGLLSFPFEN